MPVKAIPEGYHSVTPYLIIDGAAAALDFYKKAFGATELMRMPMGDRIGHAEIKLGDSHVMLSDEWPEMGHLSPKKRGGTSVSLMFYVENPTRCSIARSRLVPPSRSRSKISSTATVPAR